MCMECSVPPPTWEGGQTELSKAYVHEMFRQAHPGTGWQKGGKVGRSGGGRRMPLGDTGECFGTGDVLADGAMGAAGGI